MISIRVRYFAGHRDIVGQVEQSFELPAGTTVGALWERLAAAHPRLAGYTGRLLYAVNQEFATPATVLQQGDEVAFIPPVSGGRPGERECKK